MGSWIPDLAEEISDLAGSNPSILITILSSYEDELGVLKSLSNVSYPYNLCEQDEQDELEKGLRLEG